MVIENKDKIKIKGWLRMEDLSGGDIFIFEDNDEAVYLMDMEGRAIDVETGDGISPDDSYYNDKLVRELKCKLVIEE